MPSGQLNKFLLKRTEKIEVVAIPVCDQTIRTARCQGSREVKTRSTGKSTIRQRSTKTWYGPQNSNPTKNSWLKSTTKKSNLTCCTGWLNLEFVFTGSISLLWYDPIMRLGSNRSLLGLTCRYSPFNPWETVILGPWVTGIVYTCPLPFLLNSKEIERKVLKPSALCGLSLQSLNSVKF